MAKTITQRIALDGGKDIASQLKALGAAGEKAFKDIKAAVDKANFAKFSASLSKVRSDLANVAKNVALLGTGLASGATAAGAAMFSLAKSGAEAADAAGKGAQKAGLQIDAYQRLAFAAKQADVGNDQFVAGMSRLNKAIAEAAGQTAKTDKAFDDSGVSVQRFGGKVDKTADATKKAGTVFDRLGVKIKDANGKLRPTEAIIGDLAEAFSRLEDGPVKVALGMEIFGKSFAELIPFLNQGRDGIRDLGKEAEKLGFLFTPADAALGDSLGDMLDSLSAALFGVRKKLGLLFAPLVLVGAQAFRDLIVDNKDAILQFGAEAARVTAGVLGDLLHLLSGNTAAIKNPWIKEWSAAVIQFGNDVAGVFNGLVLPAFRLLRDGAQFVADQINRVFGTDITAGELALGTAILSAVGAFTLLASSIGAVVAGIGFLAGLVGGIPLAVAAAAVSAGVLIGVFWEEIKAGVSAAWQFITGGAAVAWQAIVDGATGLWQGIVAAFGEGQQAAVDAFNGIVDAILSVWNGLIDKLGQIAQAIVERIAGWFGTLPARITAVFNSLVSIASSVLNRVSSLVDSIVSKIQSAINLAKQLVGLGGDSGGGGTQGFRSGGVVRGPGGPRTDSILARLSAGEFVIQARAVQRLGVDFLAALNSGVDPLRALRGFSVGGVVDNFNRSMSIPRFAGGGLATANLAPASSSSKRTPLLLQFNGGTPIDDITIGDIAMNRLEREWVRHQQTSLGRRPSR
ncbi:hypothetical protein [Mesorhizobium sp. M7A.F.Ca.US.008.03.1.1]|uniref:hypothetical protein n=1 Tax=Mesorhizobium sp. M7A.F.Ca.US.008.03.1.1 TaxID=2496742 RepID=UPI000FCBD221|nr:hypothetical protein [Mesorhizobium sp. M7A.F.Ca.US.008.03.1.1]RUW62125.1 hypothetical protein EOA16_10335 [Mesorhizobium sp. M7A.F.Ca.US.008.03.1.1]